MALPRPRLVRPALVVAFLCLLAQLAMIPFHWSTSPTPFRNLASEDFHGMNFDAGPDAYVLWRVNPGPAWKTPGEMHFVGIFGLRFGRIPGLCWFVRIDFIWTIGLNAVAVLWLGRDLIARAWRVRPRLPRVRVTIEWRAACESAARFNRAESVTRSTI